MPRKISGGYQSGFYAVVQDIEHGSFFIDADFETGTGIEGDITYEYAEAYGHEQQGLEVLLNG